MPLFALPAELTLDTATAVRRQALSALAADASPWMVDAGALLTFDSSGLALLLELRRAAPQQALQVRGVPERLGDLAQAYGLDFLLAPAAPQS
ncbi:MAG: STAS domain-containing protein [Thiomonas sp.]|nr:STAS domain-containing protein [Thiomonas sp.]